jgi:hypothetical protein
MSYEYLHKWDYMLTNPNNKLEKYNLKLLILKIGNK